MVRGCRLVPSIRLNFVRLGADKANVALQQVLSDIEEVKCDVVEVKSGVVEVKNDVVARVAEVKAEVVEVKNDAQEVKCMRFSFLHRLRCRVNLPLRGTDRTRHLQMVFAS